MITKNELQKAIKQTEDAPTSFANCEKLAIYYLLYDHLFEEKAVKVEKIPQTTISVVGKSDFLQMINGAESSKVWAVMDELMETLSLLEPTLYKGVMRKLEQ